jgi:hypothetical protein
LHNRVVMAPIFFDPHVCSPPSTADLIGREMDFEPASIRELAKELYGNRNGVKQPSLSFLLSDLVERRTGLGTHQARCASKAEGGADGEFFGSGGAMRPSSRRSIRFWGALLALLVTGMGCAKSTTPAASPTPSGSPLSLQALKLAVLDAVGGHLVYCDPDLYPAARGTALENAEARLPAIRSDRATFDAILAHEGISPKKHLTPAELITINEDYKAMQELVLKTASDGAYSFTVLVPQAGSNVGILRISGTVSRFGRVTINRREMGQRPMCPICLAAGVGIATPNGAVPVEDIRVGMAVWTTDLSGRRIPGVVVKTGHMESPLGHEVIRLALADGRTVLVSPGHPTGDGRTVGDLREGDAFDGSTVTAAILIPYRGITWDLLPWGPTGTYFANGVLLGSTLSAASIEPMEQEPA